MLINGYLFRIDDSSEMKLETVEEELQKLVQEIKNYLGDNLIGFYVSGSFTMGSWIPETSDIDILLVVKRSITSDEARILDEAFSWSTNSRIIVKLEGEIVALPLLQNKNFSTLVGSISGGKVTIAPNNLSADNLACLNQYGRTFFGPEFRTLGIEVSAEELREAVQIMLEEDNEELDHNPDEKTKLYVLVDGLRSMYTLKTGKLPTKMDAITEFKALLGEELFLDLSHYIQGKKQDVNVSIETVKRILNTVLC